MPTHKNKKNVKQRGSHTHGWGAKKKHRGAGNRGGRGMAGSGKRADQKKPTILKLFGNTYFGKFGFRSIHNKSVAITLESVSTLLEKDQKQEINLKELGYDKLLGTGKFKHKAKIIVSSWSPRAEEKVKKAGGTLVKE